MQVISDDHNTAPITFGRAQVIHSNAVDAMGTEAAATGAHGHRNCLPRTQPHHNTEVSCPAETGPCRHPVPRRPHLPPLHALIMPHEPILGAT